MTYYQEKRSQPFKWLLAIIIFILAMTLTFDDVYGIWVPDSDDQKQSQPAIQQQHDVPDSYADPEPRQDSQPPQIPEPATLILLGSGLAAMHILRRRQKK